MMRCFTSFALVGLLLASAPMASAQSLIAFFDFNDGFDVDDETPSIVHAATLGAGTLYQQRADTDGNGKGGVSYINPGLGIDNTSASDDKSMAWDDISKSEPGNDAEFFIETSTLGFTNIQIRFDVEGNNDPVNSLSEYDLKFDPNPLVDVDAPLPGDAGISIKDFEDGTSTTILNNASIATDDSFQTYFIDLSGVSGVDNQSVIAFRWDDFEGNDDLRIDNVLITGIAAVPEPSSVLGLAATGLFAFVRRRTREA